MNDRPLDTLQRPLRDLRVSVTDRCNFRCTYCMPAEIFDNDFPFLSRSEILSYEEIRRLAQISTKLGVEKIRITGGEPLLRKDLPELIKMLRKIDGVKDIALTTNGTLLPQMAKPLHEAGLNRLTLSLDSLNDKTFGEINGRNVNVSTVLEGIAAAEKAGFESIKMNTVIMRGVNDSEIADMARHFKDSKHILRFIEFMDVGNTNGWRLDKVVSANEILSKIDSQMPVEAIDPNYAGEVATRYKYKDGIGEVGIISSVTKPFCGACNRARISARGELFTCLFAGKGYDLRSLIRSETDDGEIEKTMRDIWTKRADRYSELRTELTDRDDRKRVEMSHIGG